jgi:hypothetical protein
MDERRRSTRDPTYLPGVIYFNHGRDSLSCVIRDYSYDGARIVIFDPINVPNEVELVKSMARRSGSGYQA